MGKAYFKPKVWSYCTECDSEYTGSRCPMCKKRKEHKLAYERKKAYGNQAHS